MSEDTFRIERQAHFGTVRQEESIEIDQWQKRL